MSAPKSKPEADPERSHSGLHERRSFDPHSRLKVCVTGLRGIPNVMGGVETHCESLYPRIRRMHPQIDVEVIARRLYTGGRRYTYEGVRVTPLRALKTKHLEAITNTLLAVLHARFRSRADVLHIHAIGPGLLAPLARLLGLRTIVTHHGRDYRRAKWGGLSKAVLIAGERCALAAADTVLVVSSSLAEELAREYPAHAHKIVFAPNGAPKREGERPSPGDAGEGPAPPAADLLSKLGLRPRGYILAVGRLVPEKAFDDLIEAFEGMDTPLKLVIAGGADHDDGYASRLLARASDRVVFTGRLSRSSVDVLYRHADRFVLPSHHEGLPLAGLEAASFGCAMVLSDISANRDIGLPAHNYYPVGDIAALRQMLSRPREGLKVDPDDVGARFDWDAIAGQTARLYVGEGHVSH